MVIAARSSDCLLQDVDMVTPFCTQLTYEGLIDEMLSTPVWIGASSYPSI